MSDVMSNFAAVCRCGRVFDTDGEIIHCDVCVAGGYPKTKTDKMKSTLEYKAGYRDGLAAAPQCGQRP